MKTIDDALELRGRIFGAFEMAELEPDAAAREPWLTFAVVGAGPTGVELAGQIAELSRRALRRQLPQLRPRSGADRPARRRSTACFPPIPSGCAGARGATSSSSASRCASVPGSSASTRPALDLRRGDRRIEARTKIWAAGVQASPLGRILADRAGATVDRAGRVEVQPDCSLPGPSRGVRRRRPDGAERPSRAGRGRDAERPPRGDERSSRRLRGQPRPKPFRYHDLGTMATIARFRAPGSRRRPARRSTPGRWRPSATRRTRFATASSTQPSCPRWIRHSLATVIVATRGGRIVAAGGRNRRPTVTTAQGQQLVVRDVRPLHAGDELGVGVFMFMIVCTICGYLAATLLYTVAPALQARRRYGLILAISVLVPTLAYLIGGLGFGTYTGSTGTIFAFIAVGAIYTFVIGLVTRLLQVLIGPAALFVALAIFVFLNIPSLGATYTAGLLPVLALPQSLLDRSRDGQRRARHPLLRRARSKHRPAQTPCLGRRDCGPPFPARRHENSNASANTPSTPWQGLRREQRCEDPAPSKPARPRTWEGA